MRLVRKLNMMCCVVEVVVQYTVRAILIETNLRPENRIPIFDCCFLDESIIDLFSGERTKIGLFYVRAFPGP